jgi:hypothetical protein
MMSLLGNRLVLMLSKLVELLQLASPRSEPVPMLSEFGELLQLAFPRSEPPPPLMKMFRFPKQLPLATPSY